MQHNKKANKSEVVAFLSAMMRDESCTETNRLKAADMLMKLLTRAKEAKGNDLQNNEKINLEITYIGGGSDSSSGEI